MSFQLSMDCQKRGRDDYEQEVSPSKRSKTFAVVEAPVALPTPVPTPIGTTLAQQQQRALEAMVGGALETHDVEMGCDADADADAASLSSNPTHPWTAAPGMVASHSLSGSSCASSSMPTTPLDLPFHEQWMPDGAAQAQSHSGAFAAQQQQQYKAAYPSSSNPTSFTDMNGATTFFSSSPPLSLYPPPPPTPTAGAFPHANPLATFPPHAWSSTPNHHQQPHSSPTKATGVMRMEPSMGAGAAVPRDECVRQLDMPTYGWDVPRQASTLNFGGHMI
ncbi:hypothetical protein JCM8208_007822 [Rhodotorula glutinis]